MPCEPFKRLAVRTGALSADPGADREAHQAEVVDGVGNRIHALLLELEPVDPAPVLRLEPGGDEADRPPADPALILRAYLEFEDVEQGAIRIVIDRRRRTWSRPTSSGVAIDARPLGVTCPP